MLNCLHGLYLAYSTHTLSTLRLLHLLPVAAPRQFPCGECVSGIWASLFAGNTPGTGKTLHQETKVPPYADDPFLLLAQQHLALKPARITIVQWRWTEDVAKR
jgi:hypothetical protein